jgi:hypothetical protein
MDVLSVGKRRARKFMADALIWGCGLESCEPLRLVGRRFTNAAKGGCSEYSGLLEPVQQRQSIRGIRQSLQD